MEKISFVKMQGCGNDFIVIEDLNEELKDINLLASRLCDRHFGIGADGILLVKNSNIADIKMEIINADGSYAAMCGNGIRCFAMYVWQKNIIRKDKIQVESGDGIKTAIISTENNKVKSVRINMGLPKFTPKCIPLKSDEYIINKEVVINNKNYKITSLLMGVPHTVILGELSHYDVNEGKCIEKNDLFPWGTNVNFMEIIDRQEIRVKTWERGAGATLACGTGCCASVVVGNKLNFLNKKVKVNVPGGVLIIEIEDEGIFMTGSAEISFEGVCEI